MRDGRPNPDIWGNIITCGEIAVGIYEIVGSKKRGLEIPKAVAEEILPESVMEQAVQDGEALCFYRSGFQRHCCRRPAGAGACDRPEGCRTIGGHPAA